MSQSSTVRGSEKGTIDVFVLKTRSSHGVPPVSTLPRGAYEKCEFFGPTPKLLNQKLWAGGWGARICDLMNFPGVVDRYCTLRIIVLNDTALPLENQIRPVGATE